MRRRSKSVTRGVLLVIAMLWVALASSMWRSSAQRAVGPARVHIVEPGDRVPPDPGKRGATYYSLEAQTVRLVTVFRDGSKAVAQRSLAGDIATNLEDAAGTELNQVRVRRSDGVNDIVIYTPSGEMPLSVRPTPGVRTTLDWANRQSHSLYQERARSDTPLEWIGGLMRRSGASGTADQDGDVATLETLWVNGLSATTILVHPKAGQLYKGQPVRGPILVTKVMRGSIPLGTANYFALERIYAWDFPGADSGEIATEQLKARYGGWPFTPDMIWMNLQALALYQWRTDIQQNGFVARGRGCAPTAPGMTARLAAWLVPTLHANEPGCDGLHWLDGSVFRYCCDVHDACYEKYGCSASSFWRWWSSWNCDVCNIGAFFCFGGGGPHGVLQPFPY